MGVKHGDIRRVLAPQWLLPALLTAGILVVIQMTSGAKCLDPEDGLPEQRVCVFFNLVMYKGNLYYISADTSVTLPDIKYAWLKKFEGDDYFHATVVNQSSLPFEWNGTEVEYVSTSGLFHQQHYSNFYHMFSEVAPTIHHVICKYLGDCGYDPQSSLRLFFVQEKRPDLPSYIMLDSLVDVFKCFSPFPVMHKGDPQLQDKIYVLETAVVGVSPEVRVFHNWEEDLRRNWKEPPREAMQVYRQRIADCFGTPFTQRVAPRDPLRVLFVNRHYEEGRCILNAAKLAHRIRSMPEFRAFPGAQLEVVYLEAEQSIREQAALFWNASLLIWPHGATMAHTFFLPRGAQAIEVLPWWQRDKSSLPEWVQAIRDAFGLRIKLYDVQNKEAARSMFNQDKMLEYQEYRQLTAEQKIALLEKGECPQGVNDFLCPFWWNHWKVSVNFDWEALQPLVRDALNRLKSGWDEEPAQAPPVVLHPRPPPPVRRTGRQSPPPPPLAPPPPAPPGPWLPPTVVSYDWNVSTGPAAARDTGTGFPLSSYSCVYDKGSAQTRLCVFRNLVTHGGVTYYLSLDPEAVEIPDIQLAWEDWNLESGVREDKFFVPRVVRPQELPAEAATELRSGAEVVPRAALVHQVDTGNFYHLLSEVVATQFAAQCALLGLCDAESRAGLQLLFITRDPGMRFMMPAAPHAGFECLGGGSYRKAHVPPTSSKALVIRHGIVGIGPYMRAYERQEYFTGFADPPPGVMPRWRAMLARCTGTTFDRSVAPTSPLRITIVNRPWAQGRSIVNLGEVVDWMRNEWLPGLRLGVPVDVRIEGEVRHTTTLAEQVRVFTDTSVLVYPHGATMTHAMFLPRGAAILEIIPWPNVTEPHGWLQAIARQMELTELEVGLMVNKKRSNIILNWEALSKDEVWAALPEHQKIELQEHGECPEDYKPKCFFDWLHWRTNLVLDKEQLAQSLKPLLHNVLKQAKQRAGAAKAA